MNAKKKTYGVSGFMEWKALLKCGKATVSVHFSGGSLTGYGVTPAMFTTENPLKQALIENSREFKSGKIFLLREVEGTGKFKEFVRNQHANEGNHKGGQAATASIITDTTLNPNGDEKMSEDGHCTDENKPTVTDDGKPIIDVSDIDDARDYLVEEFGIARSKLRSVPSVLRAAEENGIVFRGIE